MATIIPDAGVNEREPTQIPDGALQDCDGAEYRVGQPGVYQARGRNLWGSLGYTGSGLYEAGFDGNTQFLVAHTGNSYSYAQVTEAQLSWTNFDSLTSGSSPIVGTHYASRHYTANGVQNRRLEATASGVTSFPFGMSASTFGVGTSVTSAIGGITASTGLVYWATEYDSSRGIESVTGASTNTGVVTGRTSIVAFVTGVSANPRADKIRWYRSTDGGGFPDGGLIGETAIGTTFIVDTLQTTGTLNVPSYGIVSIGGLDGERDEAPPAFSTVFGPFADSLLAVSVAEPRVLRFTPAGYPDSWPSGYGVPVETAHNDEIVTGIVLPGRAVAFCRDSVHVIYRLPRDSDSVFAAGEAQEVHTDVRGCVSRRGATVFTPPGSAGLGAWVARDGIWVSSFTTSPVPLTDGVDWEGRVSISDLDSARLVDDALNRRLVFIYRRATDTTHNTGVWYLDYQRYQDRGIRITFADHGPLADMVSVATADGCRRMVSLDSRSANGSVYQESTQDVDDSQMLDSSGSVRFRMRLKEFISGDDPQSTVSLGHATWMHDAGPAAATHRFYFNRRDDNPEVKALPQPDERNASDVILGRDVNSFSLELESTGIVSYGVHWIDIEGLQVAPRNAREGA